MGWDAKVADRGVNVSYPTDQESAFHEAQEQCLEQTGFGDKPAPYLPSEVDGMYDMLLEVAECVQDAGFPMDEPPSREFFSAGIDEGTSVWHPYDAAYEAGQLLEVEAQCPIPDEWR